MANNSNWTAALSQESRQKLVITIKDILQKHMPASGQDDELLKIACRFEQKIFQTATDENDYLKKISLKMISLETKSQNPLSNSGATQVAAANPPDPDPATLLLQQSIHNQGGLSNGYPLASFMQQQQSHQHISQSLQGSITRGGGLQSNPSLGSSLSSITQVTGLGQGSSNLSSITTLSQPLPDNTMAGVAGGGGHSSLTQNMIMAVNSRLRPMHVQQPILNHQPNFQPNFQHQQPSMQQHHHQIPSQSVLQQQQQEQIMKRQLPIMPSMHPSHHQVLGQHTNNHAQSLQQQFLQASNKTNQQQQQQSSEQMLSMFPQQVSQQHPLSTQQQQQQQQSIQSPNQQTSLSQPEQQRLQQSGALLQHQTNSLEQQKQQLLQLQQRGIPEISSALIDSSAQKGQSSVVDSHELVWAKFQALRGKYLPIMKQLYQMLEVRSQQVMAVEQQQKLQHYKNAIYRYIPYLIAPKENIPKEFGPDNVDVLEKQMSTLVDLLSRRRPPAQAQAQAQVQAEVTQHTQQTSLVSQQASLSEKLGHNMSNQGAVSTASLEPNNSLILQSSSLSPPQSTTVSMQWNILQGANTMRQQNTALPLHSNTSAIQQQHLKEQEHLKQSQQNQQFSPQILKPESPLTPFNAHSPSILTTRSPLQEELEHHKVSTASAISTITTDGSGQNAQSPGTTPNNVQSGVIATPGVSPSPLLSDFSNTPQAHSMHHHPPFPSGEKLASTESPLDHLVKLVDSMSSKSIASAVSDLNSIVNLSDKVAASAPGTQSRAAVGEDLSLLTMFRSQGRRALTSHEAPLSAKRMRRTVESMPISVVSSNGTVANSLHICNTAELASTATSRVNRSGVEVKTRLEEEMRHINDLLVHTVVEISNAGRNDTSDVNEGIVVTCTYNATASNRNVGFHSADIHMASFSPLSLLVPTNYPKCSPVVLSDPCSPDYNHPVSRMAREEFGRAVFCLLQPVLVGDIAKVWDACVRNALLKSVVQHGGGCFTSHFGVWESCPRT